MLHRRQRSIHGVVCLVLLSGCSGLIEDPPLGGATRPDGMGPGGICTSTGTLGAPVPMRRLTATQVERTIRDVLGVDGTLSVSDEKLYTYRSNVSSSIDVAAARGYLDFAEASVASADLARCATASCLDWLLDEVGVRLFRRPLDAAQRVTYTGLFDAGVAQGGSSEGARWVLEAMLQSPSFLYLDEGVEGDGMLDDYAIASRLSLVLWGANPDLELLSRAASGDLSAPAEIHDEAVRMLADPRSEGGVREFVDQWLELARLDEPDARPDLVALGPEALAAMREEPVLLFRALLVEGRGLSELLTTTHTAALPEVAPLYGADIVGSSADGVELDPARRAGVLSLPGVMAALAHAQSTSPTRRGYAVLANLLCTPPPPPPAGVNPTLPPPEPGATTRERLERHFSDPSCASCHQSMDGIGFAFEGFDWLGRTRTDDGGSPIDARSTFSLGGTDVTIDGPVELAQTLASSSMVAECVSKQWTSYATGMPYSSDSACLVRKLASDLVAADGLRTMMLTYVTSEWFRRGPAPSGAGAAP